MPNGKPSTLHRNKVLYEERFQMDRPHLRKTAFYLQKCPNASFPPQTESAFFEEKCLSVD